MNEIQKQNELTITTFMDGISEPKGYILFGIIPDKECKKTHFFRLENMQFHSSWDWLMSVVEKIETMGFQVDTLSRLLPLSMTEKDHNCFIWNDEHTYKVCETSSIESKLKATYEAIIEFINWYNKRNIRKRNKI